MITVEEYLQNPCGTLATAFWKQEHYIVPEGMTILHINDYNNNDYSEKEVRKFFRLIHTLDTVPDVSLPPGYEFRMIDPQSETEAVAEIINRSYVEYNISKSEVLRWTKFPVFDTKLWWFICQNKKPIAMGIADFDIAIGEGSVEWVQVLPEKRQQGLGKAIVNKLLVELKKKAKFATVSGEVDNQSNPEGLYRKCGFVGNNVWVVIQ